MNTESVECRRVTEIEKIGDFAFSDDFGTLYIWIPGTTGPDAISIQRGPSVQPRVWEWDGNEKKPTLNPSLLVPGQWHGFLRAGTLQSC